MTLIISQRAQAHIETAAVWYEDQRAGLEAEFLLALEAELNFIGRNPELSEVLRKGYRRNLTVRFPYSIYYKVEKENVVIVAVWHFKRRPYAWLRK